MVQGSELANEGGFVGVRFITYFKLKSKRTNVAAASIMLLTSEHSTPNKKRQKETNGKCYYF